MMAEISDEHGNSIRMINNSELLYKENDKNYVIGIVGGLGPGMDVIVYLTYIKNWDNVDAYPLTDRLVKKILGMTEKLFEQGMKMKAVISQPYAHSIPRNGIFVNVDISKLAI